MLIVELEGDDFDKSEGFVKIGRLNSAIAKAKGANNLLDSERKIFPRINAAVQLGKLKPLDPETLTPLSNSDYGTGIVTFAELVEWGQATKLFDFRRAQFTVKHIDGISTMNLAAYEEYQQALEARRSMGRYSLEEAAQFVANNSNANARSIFTKLKKSAETGELKIHLPGSNEGYKPKPRNNLSMKATLRGFEEAYWSDLNAWLGIEEKRLDCRFPEPNALAPAAKVEAVPVASQRGDDVEEQAADDDTLAALFDPVPVDVLENIFPADGKWKSWTDRAARKGLIHARVGTAMYNPYKAGMWFVTNGGKGLTIGRCRRMLANNHLPDRSMNKKYLLTGELD